MALVDIASQLEEPFPLEDIELLPKGSVERDGKTLCMAMPYADVRVYEDRLNKLACGEWSTPPPIAIAAGTKLITYVTVVVCGVAHSDVGEAQITSENAGTEAWAQAFKRACSQFGLGRYLYSLEKAWVPYNPKRKQIDLDAAGVKTIVKQMYQKAGVAFSQNGNAPKQSDNLQGLIGKAKQRAMTLKLATDKATWETLLQKATGQALQEKDINLDLIAKVNAHLAKVERSRAQPQTS